MYKLMQSLETKKFECPQCGANRIDRTLALSSGPGRVDHNRAMCRECGLESILDHFLRTAEITRLRKEQQKAVKVKLERIWFEIENNLDRFDYFREALGYSKDGAYLVFREVQSLIEKHLGECSDE